MKKTDVFIVFMIFPCFLFSQRWESPEWKSFKYPEIDFKDKAPFTEGSEIYKRIVPDPASLIRQHALWVAQTLYWSASDSMPDVKKIDYTLENVDGISAKGGNPPEVGIFYSTRWVERMKKEKDDARVLYETRGVLYHELTHAYQLEPQGIEKYKQGNEFWAYIEGMADAVRFHNGFFPMESRHPGGSWKDGYRTTGFFLEWLTCKDRDFLRKFNRSTLRVIPWSFDGAMKSIFGKNISVDGLWNEYQDFLIKNKREGD